MFLTTHYLDEADALADRLAIIDHGTIVASGTSDELKRQVAGDVVRLGVDGDRDRVIGLVAGLPFVREATAEDDLVRLYVDAARWRAAAAARPRRRGPDAPSRSRSTARASTTSSCVRPAARSATSRPPERIRQPIDPRSLRCRPSARPGSSSAARSSSPCASPRGCSMGVIQPILYLVLFGPLLEGAVDPGRVPGVNAFDWFVPGMLVMVAIFGAAFVGFGLIAELRYGVIERMRVTPMSRTAMLLGARFATRVLLLIQAVIMIVIAIPFGITIDPLGVVVTLALVGLIGLAMAPLSYSAALVLKSEDAFAPLVQFIALPLLLLSGIFLPLPARAGLAPDAGRTSTRSRTR